MKIAILFLFALVIVGCDPARYGIDQHIHADGETHFEAHYQESLFQTTDKRLYSVEMLIKDGKLVVGDNAVDIIIHGQGNKDVEGAIVSVDPYMPEHGHSLLKKPVTIERGAGLYTVSGITLMMEGVWELKVEVNVDGVKDSTSFLFQDVKPAAAYEGGHHVQGSVEKQSLTELDFSNSRASRRGIFKLSYFSDMEKLPLNKIHSWRLNLTTMKGTPVKGAKIRVSGGMPVHGHGLPTQPIMTGEAKPGQYLIEGMKFNMPGHWTVTFDLSKDDIKDSVTFNLQVR